MIFWERSPCFYIYISVYSWLRSMEWLGMLGVNFTATDFPKFTASSFCSCWRVFLPSYRVSFLLLEFFFCQRIDFIFNLIEMSTSIAKILNKNSRTILFQTNGYHVWHWLIFFWFVKSCQFPVNIPVLTFHILIKRLFEDVTLYRLCPTLLFKVNFCLNVTKYCAKNMRCQRVHEEYHLYYTFLLGEEVQKKTPLNRPKYIVLWYWLFFFRFVRSCQFLYKL